MLPDILAPFIIFAAKFSIFLLQLLSFIQPMDKDVISTFKAYYFEKNLGLQ